MDSPFDYNKKVLLEKDLIAATDANNSNWANTYAPDNRWTHYARSTANGNTAYLPSLGNYYHFPNSPYKEPEANANFINGWEREAGTDCIGFAQRCASYSNNRYTWADLPAGMAEFNNSAGTNNYTLVLNSYNNTRRYPYLDETSWEISKKALVGAPKDLSKIIPGDIFYYCDNDEGTSGGQHIAIVRSIEYDDNTRTTDIMRIHLIESTFDCTDINNRIIHVINHKTVSSYNGTDWFIVRLRMQ
jgi:hypothetical protein